MSFIHIYFSDLLVLISMMTLLWGLSIIIKNVSIVDIFWGPGFVISALYYFIETDGYPLRKIIMLILVSIWGIRLSVYLAWRNIGKGEDFRYTQFRKSYGENRYWWISFFQTFLLQGVLMWIISSPLLGAQFYAEKNSLGILDFTGLCSWIIGFCFESIGDIQLARFKADPLNKGKVLNTGLWKYTRHPNYFGDAAVWWGFGLLSMAAGSFIPVLGSLIMTGLIIKVSGVALLEKSLVEKKPQYKEYIEKTSAFLPWFPKK
jgi:steroid 5-alpha reductase family enzyme